MISNVYLIFRLEMTKQWQYGFNKMQTNIFLYPFLSVLLLFGIKIRPNSLFHEPIFMVTTLMNSAKIDILLIESFFRKLQITINVDRSQFEPKK